MAGGSLEERRFAGLFLVFSQPLPSRVFSGGERKEEPPSPPQGRAVCCSCGRCSWACWPAIVLWEPRAPAAREFWANAQPWHGPLSLANPSGPGHHDRCWEHMPGIDSLRHSHRGTAASSACSRPPCFLISTSPKEKFDFSPPFLATNPLHWAFSSLF